MTQRFSALDQNLLRVFDEVMATQNITRAAKNMAITQPAVSNALRPPARRHVTDARCLLRGTSPAGEFLRAAVWIY